MKRATYTVVRSILLVVISMTTLPLTYGKYMKLKQSINQTIQEAFDKAYQ
jgi:hypothetical protein